jgi:predicted phage terminase large subunit-like protein
MDKQDQCKYLLKNDLAFFVKKCFRTLEPNVELKWGWHLDLICLYLEAVYRKEVRRLIINIPPRNLKSITANVAFPAWCWTQDDTTKFMSASYKAELSIKHNVDTRRIVNSGWYQKYFGIQLAGDQNTKTKIETVNRGVKECGTMKSPPTGSGANIICVDDPHNTKESESEVERVKVCEGFGGDFETRLNDKKRDVIFVIMQRLHEEDLSGFLLKKKIKDKQMWQHLCIPVKADKDYTYYYPNSDKVFHVYKKGEILNEALEDQEVIDGLKVSLGSYAFAGQYMQNPAPAGGGMFKQIWWKRWKVLPKMQYRQIFGDTAQEIKKENDYSVFQCWGLGIDGNAYLIDQIRGKWEAPELLRTAIDFWNKHVVETNGKLRNMVVEKKVSGSGLIQTIQRDYKIPILPILPDKDKITRAAGVVSQIEAGFVYIPENAPWVSDFIHETSLFPNASHDDQVDVLDYALDTIMVRKPVTFKVRGQL